MSLWDTISQGRPTLGSSNVNVMNTLGQLRGGGSYDPGWASFIGSQQSGDGTQYSARGDPRLDPNGGITIDGQSYVQVGDLDPTSSGTARFHNLDPGQFQYDPVFGILTPQSNMNVQNSWLDNAMPYIVAAGLGGPALGAAMGGAGAAEAAVPGLTAADLAPLPAVTGEATLPFAATPDIIAPGAGVGAGAAGAGGAGAGTGAATTAAAAAPTVDIPGVVSQIPDLTSTLPTMAATPEIAGGAVPLIPDASGSLPAMLDNPVASAGALPFTSVADGGAFDMGGSSAFGGSTPIVGTESTGAFDVGGSTGFGGSTPIDAGSSDWFDRMLGKINPMSAASLGINLASAAAQRRNRSGIPGKLGDIAKPFQEQGQALLDQYKSGKLNPADEFNINKWVSDQTARVRDFYGRAGMGDSSAALNAVAQVEAQGQAMRDKSLSSLLTEGLSIMQIAIGPLTTAVQAEASNDAALSASVGSALSSFAMMQALSMGRAA